MVIKSDHPDAIQKVYGILKNRGIVIMKCDTIYGIVGAVPETAKKIHQLKNRTTQQPLIVLIPDQTHLANYTNDTLPEELNSFWPGPLTIVFNGKTEGTSIALRIPDDPFLITVMQKAECALYSTSVNEHGRFAINMIDEIIDLYQNRVDLIVDSGNFEDFRMPTPSTLIDIRPTPYKLLRDGAVTLPKILFE